MKLVAPAIFSLLSWAAHAETIAGRASVIDTLNSTAMNTG